jgi:hypothetical protein
MLMTRLAAGAAALVLVGAVLSVAGTALADEPTTSLVPCAPATSTSTTGPLYSANCAPTVSGTAPGTITVTLPGVGSVTFTVGLDGTIDTSTQPSVSLIGQNFSAGTPKISADGTRITISFVNIAAPEQHYTIKVKISPPTSEGAKPTVSAVAKVGHHENEQGDDNGQGDEDQHGSAPAEHDDEHHAGNQAPVIANQGQHHDGGSGGGDSGGDD